MRAYGNQTQECPDCGGPKAYISQRCRKCSVQRRAKAPAQPCPDCGKPKRSATAKQCWDCYSKRTPRPRQPITGITVECQKCGEPGKPIVVGLDYEERNLNLCLHHALQEYQAYCEHVIKQVGLKLKEIR
jgi:NMD protein affecting ribosome stability and mRNA decay